MKRLVPIIIACLLTSNVYSQSMVGITGQRDTSFTTNSAFLSAKKIYPNIKIVEEFHPSTIKEKKNIAYNKIGDRKLLLDAFYPKEKSKAKRIAIIIIHGGGWRSGNRTQHYPLAQTSCRSWLCMFYPGIQTFYRSIISRSYK